MKLVILNNTIVHEGYSVLVVVMRMSILIRFSTVSGPSSMSDADVALVLPFNAGSQLLQAITSVSIFQCIFCDHYVVCPVL